MNKVEFGKTNEKNIGSLDELGEISGVIGIVGFGHLGSSLACPRVRYGFSKERLMISHRGSVSTRERAVRMGLGDCLADTEILMSTADIIFIATRPQDVLSLPVSSTKRGALVVSCMAGLPLDLLEDIFGGPVCRMMCSGPDTIMEGGGVATAFPGDARLEAALRVIGMRMMGVGSEEELDSFTVGICIPAMLLNIPTQRGDVRDAMSRMEVSYPVYGELREWIRGLLPDGDGEKIPEDRDERLANVSTKGGITEAMTTCLLSGATFGAALARGMERGREISEGIRKSVMDSVKLAG
jgi:pyrroline-5-carboxylate reductase